MAYQPKQLEAEAALERNRRLQRELKRKRLGCLLLGTGLLLAGVAVSVAGLPMIGYCVVLVGLISLVWAFDAHGHLHEVRQRGTKTLVSPISLVLGKPASAPSEQKQSPTP